MTVGLAATTLANKWLDMLSSTAFTAPTAVWLEEHVGDPGVAGTTSVGAVTTRQQATFNAASGGSKTLLNTPTFTQTATETISHVAAFDASTVGNFLFSAVLAVAKSVVATDTLTFTTLTISFTPIAA